MKIKYLFLSVLSILFTKTPVLCQEINMDLFVFGYQNEIRETPYLAYQITGIAHVGLSFSDTLSKKLDYKVGLGYNHFVENYYSNFQLKSDTLDGQVFTNTGKIGDRYKAFNLSLSLGAVYWPRQKRKGLFFPLEVLTMMPVSAELEEYRFDEDDKREFYYSDAIDSYNKINVIFITGVGYKLLVYKGLSVSVEFNLLFRFGDVIKGVDDSFAFNRGLTLSGGYKF